MKNNIIERYFMCTKCYNIATIGIHLDGKAEIYFDGDVAIRRNGHEISCSCHNCNNPMDEVTKEFAENAKKLVNSGIIIDDYDVILTGSDGNYELTAILKIKITSRLVYGKFDMEFKENSISDKFNKISILTVANDNDWDITIKSDSVKCGNMIAAANIIKGFIHIFDSIISNISSDI